LAIEEPWDGGVSGGGESDGGDEESPGLSFCEDPEDEDESEGEDESEAAEDDALSSDSVNLAESASPSAGELDLSSVPSPYLLFIHLGYWNERVGVASSDELVLNRDIL
jgi:hypothetical protein